MEIIKFVYTIDSRVVWISADIFQISVFNELYRVYQIENINSEVSLENCIHYTVKDFHNFNQKKLIYSPLGEDNSDQWRIYYHKIKTYLHLCDIINLSIRSARPPLLFTPADIFEVAAKSIVPFNEYDEAEKNKHLEFMKQLSDEKTSELKKRYLNYICQIKIAATCDDLEKIRNQITFNGIHLV